MSMLIKRTLFYDWKNKSWFITSQSDYKKRISTKTVYWGTPPVPVKMFVEKKGSRNASDARIQMNILLKSSRRKPLLGPLIGILSSQGRNGKLKGFCSNYKDVIQSGQKHGAIVFVFTPQNINWTSKTIDGQMYHFERNEWVACRFPFPNVVYNRIHNRKYEQKKLYQKCLQKFQSYRGMTLFNPQFFSKDNLFSILKSAHQLKPYLPDTLKLQTKQDLFRMVDKHTTVYIKPIEGKAGSGILKVEASTPNKRYCLSFYEGKRVKTIQTYKKNKLWNSIQHNMVSTPYLIQQGIPLAKIKKCPFDFRVLIQKNRKGMWKVSGLGLRVAGNQHSITTHVPKGGRVANFEKEIPGVFSASEMKDMKKQVQHLSLSVAKELDKHHTHLGEMTVDIGVDKSGHPWFFEANSKPMKFDEPHIRKKQLANIIRYAQYLTFK